MSQIGFNCSTNSISNISVPLDEFKHALFIGKTGNGKTTGAINPIMQTRIEAGYGMLVFDEKGKEHRVVKSLAAQHGRLGDVIELGKPHGIKLNLLSHLSERQMESFIRRLMKRSADSFWVEGSINMVLPLVKWLKSMKKLHAFGVEKFGMEKSILRYTHKESNSKDSKTYEWTLSTYPLTCKELSSYFHNAAAFAMVSKYGEKYSSKLIDNILESIDIKHIQECYQIESMLIAEALIDELEAQQALLSGKNIKEDLSEASGNNGLYFGLSSVLSVVGSNSYINDPDANDLSELLGEGKIIIVNTESFSTPILSTLLDQTLESLSTRSKQKNAHPISVIIDEANRVLTAESDIRIDVLRESKVEVIMAAQNHEQMITKMGSDKWWSFAQNFNIRYHFLGASQKRGIFKVLDELSEREFEAHGLFFEEEELDFIEWKYQRMHKYYSRYIQYEPSTIVLYDHLLMEKENKILLYDFKSKETSSVILMPNAENVKSRIILGYCISMRENLLDQEKKYSN